MTHPTARSPLSNRWVQLTAGIVGMVAVANFQYAWTLFVDPLQQRHGWERVQVLDALTIFFTLSQTWLVPAEAYLADRFGPRRLLVAGGLLAGLAWVINAHATTLPVLYAAQVLGGCGSGMVYGISVGNALKWFPDRRGLASGLTAAAFGAGAAATVLPIQYTIKHHGYETAFLWFGLGQGLIVVLAGLVTRFPDATDLTPHQLSIVKTTTTCECHPWEMLRSPVFWLLYAMMTVGAVPGLLMMGQLEPMSRDFGVGNTQLSFLIWTNSAVSFALIIDRITGGLTRPVFGWLSDRIGRESAIALAFGLEGASLLVLYVYRTDPTMFVITTGVAFFGWGAVFSLFPAVSGDLFGRKFATTNYSLLYTAKGAATILVSLCNRVQAGTGSWFVVFAAMIAFDWLAATLAIFVLRPWRRRWLA
jgi:OFA family oxalate/formate antiporter-like MFS transporter